MIKIYAPASIGNIIVGFDSLGAAISPNKDVLLGDCVSVEYSTHFSLDNKGNFANNLPVKLDQNIIYQCWKHFCKKVGKFYPVKVILEKNVPISSGLGSSACSIVALLKAMNIYCNYPLSKNQMLILMGKMEGLISGEAHFDNIVPCFLGGTQLIIFDQNIIINQLIPSFLEWQWVIAYPGVKIETSIARKILPKYYCRQDCINHGRYLAGFIHACHIKKSKLAIKFMKDIIAEPYRISLMMDLISIRKIMLSIGALICGISGSGPTLFVICDNINIAESVADWLTENFLKNKNGFVHICHIDFNGARVID